MSLSFKVNIRGDLKIIYLIIVDKMWSNYHTGKEGVVKDAPQRVAITLTCSDILNDNGQISKMLLDYGYRHLVLKYNGGDLEDDVLLTAGNIMSMIRGTDGGVVTLVVNVQNECLPNYLFKLVSTVSQSCCCVMLESPLQLLVHHLCSVNEIVKKVNNSIFQALVARETSEPGQNLTNTFCPIPIGFTCSSGAENPSQVTLLKQGNVERILDRLQTDFTIPVTNIAMVQLPDRSSNSNVQIPDTANNYPNSVKLPNLSTRLVDLLHSRGINCLIELHTSDDMMALYELEAVIFNREAEEQNRLLVTNRHKVNKQAIVRTDSMFNVNEAFGPASRKYRRHVFLVLIKVFLQLGAIVTVPFKELFATTQIPLVVVPEMPPITVVVNNNIAALTRGRDTDSKVTEAEEEQVEAIEDGEVAMETLTYGKLVSTILHPFIYRKEAASTTRVMKFQIGQPDMDRFTENSNTVEQVADRDEHFHNLGNTKPPLRNLRF